MIFEMIVSIHNFEKSSRRLILHERSFEYFLPAGLTKIFKTGPKFEEHDT